MSDSNAAPPGANGTPPPAAPPPPPPAAAAAAADDGGATITIPSREMAKRNEEERAKGRARLLKDLGFEKPEDASAALAEWKKLREEKMSAEEKTAAQLKALSAEAEHGKAAAAVAQQAIDALKGTLSEPQRAALDKYAPEGTPVDAVLRTITMIRELAGNAAAPPANAPPPPPANTTPPGGAPRPGEPKSPYQQWTEMGGNASFRGAAFYQVNRSAIEASRPPPGA